ncbi:MAG: hypothetical protein GC180_11730 [Bacteroidetes bacterium]|nr:hypothetical protein [Bacteroidota bacterium]
MNRFIFLIRHDLNTSFRDPLFKGLMFFPFVCFILVRWVFPVLFESFPVLNAYREVFVMWACMQSATMFGFIYGFLMLEEKEENLLRALRILPVPTGLLIAVRQTIGILISSAVNFCILEWGGILPVNPSVYLLIAFQMSLLSPLIMLLLTVLAKTRMEGLAQMKIFNLLFIAPGIVFFLPQKALHAFALIPTYWSFRAIDRSLISGWNPWLWGGFVFYFGLLFVLNRVFSKRVFV